MKIRHLLAPAVLATATVLVLGGCSSQSSSPGASGSAASGSAPSVSAPSVSAPSVSKAVAAALSGQLGDKSFMDSADTGFKEADSKLGTSIKVIEAGASDSTAWNRNLTQTSASGNYGLIITGGTVVASTLKTVAKQFPKQNYLIFDSPAVGDNTTGISYKQNESAFMAGALAAEVTTHASEFPRAKGTKRVGIAGGMDIPVIRDYIDGFTQGAEAVDPSITVDVRFINDFASAQKGYDLAKSMYNAGDDVVYQAAGAAGLGVLQAGEDLGRYSIGTDSNQNYLHPKSVVGSALKQVGTSIYTSVQSYLKGDLKGGTTIYGTLKNGGVGIAYSDALVPADVKTALGKFQSQIDDGTIKVKTAL